MSHKTNISILIVTHNHADYILDLLESLERFQYHDVYICDAASTDNTVVLLSRSAYKANVLIKHKLEGFSKNNNDLIKHFNLKSDFFLLLNPDLYFDEDFIFKLYNTMRSNPSIGIAAPKIYYPNGNLQVTWKTFPRIMHVIKKRLGILKVENEKQMNAGRIDWCLGACMLISAKLLKDNNTLLDERYRLYCEDSDICFEAHTKNLLVMGIDNAYAYHHLNQLSSKKIFSKYNFWNISSIIKFALKWNFKYFAKLS